MQYNRYNSSIGFTMEMQKFSYNLKFLYYGVFVLTFIPVPYLVFNIANYGYGLTYKGILVWLASLLLVSILVIPVKFRIEAHKPIAPKKLGKVGKRYLHLSYFGAIVLLIENLYLRRPSDMSLLDINSMYEYLGKAGSDAEGLSVVGMIGFLLSGLSFYFLSRSVLRPSFKEKIYFALPSFIVMINMAIIGARQIIMFGLLLYLSTYSLQSSSISKHRYRTIVIVVVLLSMILASGYYRLATHNVDDAIGNLVKLANIRENTYLPQQVYGLVVYLFLYIGNSPEVLSVYMSESEPCYIPFSNTNALVYRNLGKIFDLPSYEDEIRLKFHDPFERATGFFPRVWGTGNLQLYFEGGVVYIVMWYWFLGYWFVKIVRDSKNGKDVSVSLGFFSAIIIMHQMVFPIRDSRIFLAFVGFLVLNRLERKGQFMDNINGKSELGR